MCQAHNMCSRFWNTWWYNQPSSLFTKMQRALFAIAVKHHAGSNRPTNNGNSFDDTVTASTVNLGINSSQTECKADEHSSKKW